jgi:hypothetical protein
MLLETGFHDGFALHRRHLGSKAAVVPGKSVLFPVPFAAFAFISI